jgi:hypothetical protein
VHDDPGALHQCLAALTRLHRLDLSFHYAQRYQEFPEQVGRPAWRLAPAGLAWPGLAGWAAACWDWWLPAGQPLWCGGVGVRAGRAGHPPTHRHLPGPQVVRELLPLLTRIDTVVLAGKMPADTAIAIGVLDPEPPVEFVKFQVWGQGGGVWGGGEGCWPLPCRWAGPPEVT